MLTNAPINDILLISARRGLFYCPKLAQSRLGRLSRFLADDRNAPFLLEKIMDWRKLPRPYRKTGKFRNCLQCKKSFYVFKSRLSEKKYCSRKCKHLAQKQTMAGKNNHFYGKKHTKRTKELISLKHMGNHHSSQTEFKTGKNHFNWKGGISSTKEYKKLHCTKRHTLAGNLSIKQIQMLYEDNIKYFGTLTCYLCLEPIEFGQDCIEHKIPISRGGTNKYKNLAIAHRSCNAKKRSKTEKEYRKEIVK